MRPCPRTLDKPILLFGLELEDLGLLFLIGGGGGLLMGPLVPGLLTMAAWAALVHFKKDKPEGYLLHRLYAGGCRMPGLLPPPKEVTHYGAYAATR